MMGNAGDMVSAIRIVRVGDLVDGPTADFQAWQDQAQRARDAALRMMRERFARDLEESGLVLGGNNKSALAVRAEYADALTAAYLIESEKLFSMLRPL